ncbi:MAG: hypothetical protein IKJ28_04180 [Alphaproteobacteria bacterium]|nr:hypothetical protein [Alphaproteobacteria bacterium]
MQTKFNEIGRSMIEILGVLAVIGVLSVAGVMGYRYAMDKYRANEIVYAVNMVNRDIWHRFQVENSLPDDIEEYDNLSPAGYNLKVYTYPPLVFDIKVNRVESRVCRQILNMHLEGPLFIYVAQNETDEGVLYTNNNVSICEDTGTFVTMGFMTSLEHYGQEIGIHEDSTDERGQPIRYCRSDNDCYSACESCFTAYPYTCRSICESDSAPVCLSSGECVECEFTPDCKRKDTVCNDLTHKCEVVEKACPIGTFRSSNGKCISCQEPTNIMVSNEIFELNGLKLDAISGAEMCSACATASDNAHERIVESLEVDGETKTFCSYSCTKGVSFQAKDGTCVPCSDTQEWIIANDDESKNKCTACQNHIWYTSRSVTVCGLGVKCSDTQFIYSEYDGTNYRLTCKECTDLRNQRGTISYAGNSSSSDSFVQSINASCNNCPEYVNGSYAKRYHYLYQGLWDYCYPVCEQPKDEVMSVEICKENPLAENCLRKWQNSDGNCLACNYIGTATYIGESPVLKDLCKKCGRRVNSQGYCVPQSTNACLAGQFLGADGNCWSCDEPSGKIIENTELSGCESNCTKAQETDTDYVANSVVKTRRVVSNDEGTNQYCMPICPAGYFQTEDGQCIDCLDTKGYWVTYQNNFKILQDECVSRCDNTRTLIHQSMRCVLKTCPNTSTGVKQFHKYLGECTPCDQINSEHLSSEVTHFPGECEACGNRILIGRYPYCVLVNPGISGICNSLTHVPTELDTDLKNQAQPYLDKQYDGILYLGSEGNCHRCDDKASYTAPYQAITGQCATCGNRQSSGNTCMYGLCTEGEAFLNMTSNCINCSETGRTQIPNTQTAHNLCESCEEVEHRIMMLKNDTDEQTYCVESCVGSQWQRASDGKCLYCDDLATQVVEIGADEESKQECIDCDRIAFEKEDGKTYCSQKTKQGFFINSDGMPVSCSVSEDVLIPATQGALSLCIQDSCNREIARSEDNFTYICRLKETNG